MILGTGIDIIEVWRIEEAVRRHGDRFLDRVYTTAERAYCDALASPTLHYAARFAAKEAFSKALGLGIAQGMAWKDIAIRNDARGAPRLELSGRASQLAADLGISAAHVSLSHSQSVAAAVVILEGERPEESPLPPVS
jgi:holo-[acyl-carrier protein] synthase